MDFIPCVIIRASEKLRNLLVTEGKGKPVELRERIITSSYEQNGAIVLVLIIGGLWFRIRPSFILRFCIVR